MKDSLFHRIMATFLREQHLMTVSYRCGFKGSPNRMLCLMVPPMIHASCDEKLKLPTTCLDPCNTIIWSHKQDNSEDWNKTTAKHQHLPAMNCFENNTFSKVRACSIFLNQGKRSNLHQKVHKMD